MIRVVSFAECRSRAGHSSGIVSSSSVSAGAARSSSTVTSVAGVRGPSDCIPISMQVLKVTTETEVWALQKANVIMAIV